MCPGPTVAVVSTRGLIAPEFSSGGVITLGYYLGRDTASPRPGTEPASRHGRRPCTWSVGEKYLLSCKNICCCLQVRSQQRPGPHIKSQDTFSKQSWRRKYEEIETVLWTLKRIKHILMIYRFSILFSTIVPTKLNYIVSNKTWYRHIVFFISLHTISRLQA